VPKLTSIKGIKSSDEEAPKMKSTQNAKILQQTPDTLVIGIDIGKTTHYARAFDYRGIELTKVLRFNNTREGFESFDRWKHDTMQKYGKTEVRVGFEPTGHYWFALGDHLQKTDCKLSIVNPFHVKCSRELDDNSQTKTDRKDPETIAKLVKDGRYREVYIPQDVYMELREAVSGHEAIRNQQGALSNQIIRWLDIRFPEFTEVFANWRGNAATEVLKHCPTPSMILALGAEGVMKIWRKRLMKPSSKKAEKLLLAAERSIGKRDGEKAATQSLKCLLAQHELLEVQCREQETLMQELLLQVPNADKLLDIKGIGNVLAAYIVSELGDIHRFQDPRQIQKMAGLALRENSSGKHKGKTTISKRGRRLLREALFRAVIAMLATNDEFRALHQRNLTREKNPLTKMQSVIALCGKLIRVVFGILTKGFEYDPGKLMLDATHSMIAA